MANGAPGAARQADFPPPQANPNASVPKRKRRRKRRLPRTLSRDEVERLLAAPNLSALTGLRDRCMLELMYRAGLRVSEVCALEPRDVDVAASTVRVIDGKGGDGTAYFDPKSVARDGQSIAGLLDRWKDQRRRHGLAKSPFLFCTVRATNTVRGGAKEAGAPVRPRQLQDMMKRRARKAGIDPTKVSPHVLRHTFATELLDEGLHIRLVQEAMRHANIGTTEVYLHVIDSDLRKRITERER